MNVRYASALILASLSLGAIAPAATAQDLGSRSADTRTDLVAGARNLDAARALKSRTTGYVSRQESYTTAGSVVVVPPTTRTLNVWGARIDAPAY